MSRNYFKLRNKLAIDIIILYKTSPILPLSIKIKLDKQFDRNCTHCMIKTMDYGVLRFCMATTNLFFASYPDNFQIPKRKIFLFRNGYGLLTERTKYKELLSFKTMTQKIMKNVFKSHVCIRPIGPIFYFIYCTFKPI